MGRLSVELLVDGNIPASFCTFSPEMHSGVRLKQLLRQATYPDFGSRVGKLRALSRIGTSNVISRQASLAKFTCLDQKQHLRKNLDPHLCIKPSLDTFTAVHAPIYIGDFLEDWQLSRHFLILGLAIINVSWENKKSSYKMWREISKHPPRHQQQPTTCFSCTLRTTSPLEACGSPNAALLWEEPSSRKSFTRS